MEDDVTEMVLKKFAQKLADSEKRVRDRAVKKFRQWLMLQTQKGALINEDDMMKIWKALFFCMWMSDKPLVQEGLSENLSGFMHAIKGDDNVMLFLKCALLTIGSEWAKIDKYRFEKFQMLVRRLIRQAFVWLKNKNWDAEAIENFVDVLKVTVVNVEQPHLSVIPIGLKTHVSDLYCEEIAKIGGETLSSEQVFSLIKPYGEALQECEDSRLSNAIMKRVFEYLMRQSDVGLKHEAQAATGVELDEGMEEEENEEESEEEDDDLPTSGVLDPRAGRVDVALPQLPLDFHQCSDWLFELGAQKSVTQKNRELIYDLAKKFEVISKGDFPIPCLQVPPPKLLDERVPRSEVLKALKRAQKMELNLQKESRVEKLEFSNGKIMKRGKRSSKRRRVR